MSLILLTFFLEIDEGMKGEEEVDSEAKREEEEGYPISGAVPVFSTGEFPLLMAKCYVLVTIV